MACVSRAASLVGWAMDLRGLARSAQPLHDLGGGGPERWGRLRALLEDVACQGWSPLLHVHHAPRAGILVLQALLCQGEMQEEGHRVV